MCNKKEFKTVLEIKDLIGEEEIKICTSKGELYKVPASSIPVLNDTKSVIVYPSIGNIIHPFPDIITISLADNQDLTIKFLETNEIYQEKLDWKTIKNSSTLVFENKKPLNTLKSHFWYYFNLNSDISDNFCKNIKKKINLRTLCYNPINYSQSIQNRKKKIEWDPEFEFI